jgi:hypothetical protein
MNTGNIGYGWQDGNTRYNPNFPPRHMFYNYYGSEGW